MNLGPTSIIQLVLALSPRETLVNSLAVTTEITRSEVVYLGEPVELRVVSRNRGAETIRGYVIGNPGHPNVSYFHRHDNKTNRLEPRTRGAEREDVSFAPSTLRPGETRELIVRWIAYPGTHDLIADVPGIHEFFVVVHPMVDRDSSVEVRSTVASVKIQLPPPGETAAFTAFKDAKLAELVGSAISCLDREPAVIERAIRFLDEHVDSIYAKHVRSALFSGLRFRQNHGIATPAQKAVYERLQQDSQSVDR